MSKQKAKKYSSIKDNSMLAPPAGFDSKKYAGRWVAEQRLHARTDGYEPRGFQVYKDANGQSIKAGDLVWCFMTKEDAEERKGELHAAARSQIYDLKDKSDEQDDRLAFELEKAGGKIETKITIE